MNSPTAVGTKDKVQRNKKNQHTHTNEMVKILSTFWLREVHVAWPRIILILFIVHTKIKAKNLNEFLMRRIEQ